MNNNVTVTMTSVWPMNMVRMILHYDKFQNYNPCWLVPQFTVGWESYL